MTLHSTLFALVVTCSDSTFGEVCFTIGTIGEENMLSSTNSTGDKIKCIFVSKVIWYLMRKYFPQSRIRVSRSLSALQMTLILRSNKDSKYRAKNILKRPKWYIIRSFRFERRTIQIQWSKDKQWSTKHKHRKTEIEQQVPTKKRRWTQVFSRQFLLH